MYFLGLAVDYDGTIANDGRVTAATLEALIRFRASGRRLVLVTGRRLEAIVQAFPQYRVFDRLVVENGAVIHAPDEDRTEVLTWPPDARLVDFLRTRVRTPIEIGQAIVAGWEPDQAIFLEAVRQFGLEMQIIFNKGAIMLLPTGVNKASGLRAAARELKLETAALVGVGDAENDHSFLGICGCACATQNAVASLKAEADIVTVGDHGAGVEWLAGQIVARDRALLPTDRHGLPIGTTRANDVVRLSRHRGNVLIVGPSGIGKSSLATLICECAAHAEQGYAAIDPEGDYAQLAGAGIVDLSQPGLGVADYEALLHAHINPVLILRGVEADKRQALFAAALKMVLACNAKSGHPGFLVVDEAHECLSCAPAVSLDAGPCVVLLTLNPRLVAPEVLDTVETVIAFGPDAPALLATFASARNLDVPQVAIDDLSAPALLWRLGLPPTGFRPFSPKGRHIRHAGKYAVGDVGPERSFYFRGAHDQYLVRARNLFEFIAVARQLPIAVWSHHLRNGDVARWFTSVIRDTSLAARAQALAGDSRITPALSLDEISDLVLKRYLAPPLVAPAVNTGTQKEHGAVA